MLRERQKRRGEKPDESSGIIEHFKKSSNKPLFLKDNPAPSAVLIF
jgi:hypothetical protein